MIVAPSLKVSAELAASRGDPKLFQDLASMLCLIHLISSLKEFYIDEWAVMSAMSNEGSLRKAHEAACMMVLTEANVDKSELVGMMNSLNRAYHQVVEADITFESDLEIKRAWCAIKKNQCEQFLVVLEQAAKKFVQAFDSWEGKRNK